MDFPQSSVCYVRTDHFRGSGASRGGRLATPQKKGLREKGSGAPGGETRPDDGEWKDYAVTAELPSAYLFKEIPHSANYARCDGLSIWSEFI